MKLLPRHRARRTRLAAFLSRLLLVCAFAWNQYYVPIHLAGHDHLHGDEHHADEVFGALDHGPEEEEHHEDESGHDPHPASDHLSGFLAHACIEISLDVQLVCVPAPDVAPVAGHAQHSSFSLSVRGPPSLLSA